MAKSSNQKLKMLYILKFLYTESDENNLKSTNDIISYLDSLGIKAERKSIYSDIELLCEFGVDIIYKKEKNGGYYVAGREFELAELKLLVDAVWSSRFITTKKSRTLVKKLENLTSRGEAKKLERQILLSDRIKAVNESIYYNVDCIHEAIGKNVNITFRYFEWMPDKKMSYKHAGKRYEVSPWTLYWSDENYYLISYDAAEGIIKYFRTDKMKDIEFTENKRDGRMAYEELITGDFAKKNFNMFSGRTEYVSLIVSNHLAGVIIDRFGQAVYMRPYDDGHFKVCANVVVSSQFFGWLAGLSSGAVIENPQAVAQEFKEYIETILDQYDIKKNIDK